MPAVPANLVVGFLGVGKTTAVLDLLKRKNPAEKWAVLVNEYGAVAIDDAFIEGETAAEGVSVRSVAGGCFCCTTAPMLPVALHFLLRDATLDRLLIETSGLGHPARLVDTIRTNYAGRLDLRTTLGIVTPSDFAAPGMIDSNPVFRDQVTMADVLVLNKSDTAEPGLVERFQSWANGLYPPKLLVAATEQGRIDPAWLDLGANEERRAFLESTHDHESEAPQQLEWALPGRPLRYPSPGACGWVFTPADVFDEDRLLAFLGRFSRAKGVFRLNEEWIAINRAGGETSVRTTAYRRDSRVEVFGDVDWNDAERELLSCLHTV